MSSEDSEKKRYTADDTREWIERLTRRHLGDARIHRSQAAGQLARRLGARAFTAGRDIYVQPELGDPDTPEGAALLAHELYHVAEQSGATLPPMSEMPLLAPSSPFMPQSGANFGYGAEGTTSRGAVSVQRSTASTASEQSAENVEAAMRSQRATPKKTAQSKAPDPEELADRVYRLIMMDLVTDMERNA